MKAIFSHTGLRTESIHVNFIEDFVKTSLIFQLQQLTSEFKSIYMVF